MFGADPAEDGHRADAGLQIRFGHLVQLAAGDDARLVVHHAERPADGFGGQVLVPGQHHRPHPGSTQLRDGLAHAGRGRIHDADKADEGEILHRALVGRVHPTLGQGQHAETRAGPRVVDLHQRVAALLIQELPLGPPRTHVEHLLWGVLGVRHGVAAGIVK